MLSLRSRHITLEGDKAAECDQYNSKAGEKAGIGDNRTGDEVGELGRDDAERADAGEDPADHRDGAAPVGRPGVVDIENVEAGDQRQDSGKVDEGEAAEELRRHLAVGRLV